MRLRPTPLKKTKSPNLIDRAVGFFSPVAAARRLRARIAMEALGSYTGASKSRRSMSAWQTSGSDPDTDILTDLPVLRERSRDLVRNQPLAGGAVKTKVTHVVGTGFRLQSRIDRDVLNLSEEAADLLESQIEREWRLFWESKNLDMARLQNGADLTRMIYRQVLENGDVFVLLPRLMLPGMAYALRLQVIEADRVCNQDDAADSDAVAGGVERDKTTGAPAYYHVLETHPGRLISTAAQKWRRVPAFGSKTGLPNIIHLYNPTRPGQSRGVPDLSPVIELFKQLSRYTEAEIMAAVISGFFTVFIESDGGGIGNFEYSNLGDETGQKTGDKDLKLGNGLIMELAAGEKVHDSNPGRPNNNFDPFVQAIMRQIGAGLEIPFEILIKHFTKSYSAARAALLEFWAYVKSERRWLADNFIQPVFDTWMYEAVSSGRIAAPGFFSDPAIRKAYCGAAWVGPAKGQIDEVKEVNAAVARIDAGLSTLAHETAELTGQDWERNHKQQVKEHKMRSAAGLGVQDTGAAVEEPHDDEQDED